MMLHIIAEGPDGQPRGVGATNVKAMPSEGDIVTMETSSGTIKLEVIETHHTSKRLSKHFSDEVEWAYCRPV